MLNLPGRGSSRRPSNGASEHALACLLEVGFGSAVVEMKPVERKPNVLSSSSSSSLLLLLEGGL